MYYAAACPGEEMFGYYAKFLAGAGLRQRSYRIVDAAAEAA
jgi:hypothetical protein